MTPIFRMIVCSDFHYQADRAVERERFERGLELAYAYADGQTYPVIDAIYVVGDFANSGSREEMLLFRDSLDRGLRPETEAVLTMASHEFGGEGREAGAHQRFAEIFRMPPDQHRVMKGFHLISLTTERGCSIGEGKQAWLAAELKKAAADEPRRPIFVFQHPHLTDTVYGSIYWATEEINQILMNYPQVVDFSGHSHAPINDPRSIHQRYFTAVGTGSMRYFELDEFDKQTGTVPPDANECAQMLIVEADAAGCVRILPLDILSGNFFHDGWVVETPWDPESFTYTDARYRTGDRPVFAEGAAAEFTLNDGRAAVTFPQAGGRERPDSYTVTIRERETGVIRRQINVTSSYYLYHMPPAVRVEFELEPGRYRAEVRANSFWRTRSEPITGENDA